ncbi:hypothetical protein BU14_0115s0024 [Porphyra umbilicalis]|uniref:dCTP pyrophosphatase 1 n=1 Tax=Porphyra umbilicalis TaxID=2786 RepID=A0A1X6PBN4_PORUM|nr:hypothetical protein BU14_0115s0024 [Porphyra umbilicalis]|eukprot:OSX78254.1 hypothetical protein BU14_0115s0024 [Porphyra umbilicalis]
MAPTVWPTTGPYASLEDIRARQAAFATARDWGAYHTPRNLLLALVGEVGELAECFQWKPDAVPGGGGGRGAAAAAASSANGGGHGGGNCGGNGGDDGGRPSALGPDWSAEEVTHLGEELADVTLYLIRLADVCGVDLPAAVHRKVGLNGVKYPARRARGRATKYTGLAAEAAAEAAAATAAGGATAGGGGVRATPPQMWPHLHPPRRRPASPPPRPSWKLPLSPSRPPRPGRRPTRRPPPPPPPQRSPTSGRSAGRRPTRRLPPPPPPERSPTSGRSAASTRRRGARGCLPQPPPRSGGSGRCRRRPSWRRTPHRGSLRPPRGRAPDAPVTVAAGVVAAGGGVPPTAVEGVVAAVTHRRLLLPGRPPTAAAAVDMGCRAPDAHDCRRAWHARGVRFASCCRCRAGGIASASIGHRCLFLRVAGGGGGG